MIMRLSYISKIIETLHLSVQFISFEETKNFLYLFFHEFNLDHRPQLRKKYFQYSLILALLKHLSSVNTRYFISSILLAFISKVHDYSLDEA